MLKPILFVIAMTLLLFSCTSNNEEDLPQNPAACDTLNRSYAQHIASIFQNNKCLDCHSAQTATAGIILDNYDDVANNADRVLPAISWPPSLPAGKKMPVGGPQVSDCEIRQFE